MWPFRATAKEPGLLERIEKLERTLEEALGENKRAIRNLDHDMDSLWDKVKHWSGRQAKRLGNTIAEVTTTTPPTPGDSTAVPRDPSSTAPAVDWNAKILERRKRALPNRSE